MGVVYSLWVVGLGAAGDVGGGHWRTIEWEARQDRSYFSGRASATGDPFQNRGLAMQKNANGWCEQMVHWKIDDVILTAFYLKVCQLRSLSTLRSRGRWLANNAYKSTTERKRSSWMEENSMVIEPKRIHQMLHDAAEGGLLCRAWTFCIVGEISLADHRETDLRSFL